MIKETSVVYIRILLSTLERLGTSPSNFIERNKLKNLGNISEFIPLNSAINYWNTAAQDTQHAGIGFEAGKGLQHSDLGYFIYAAMNCSTLGEAQNLLLKYIPHSSKPLSIHFEDIDRETRRGSYYFEGLSDEEARHLIELNITINLAITRMLLSKTAGDISFKEVHFKHSEIYPRHFYEEYFSCPVKFSQQENLFLFDKKMLDIEIPDNNPTIKKIIINRIQAKIEKANAKQQKLISEKVSVFVDENFGSKPPTASEAAQYFAMSLSTFNRKLDNERTSYAKILNRAKENLAISLLITSNESIDQIAYQLGFSYTGSFTRAFKRWTGETPKHYRDKNRQK